MKKMQLGLGALAMVVVVLAVAIACQPASSEMGSVTLSMTDAPLMADDIKGVYITVDEIQYHIQDEQWQTLSDFEGPQTFNLMARTGGATHLLGELVLPAGEYTQVRFMLTAPEDSESPPNQTAGAWIEKGATDDGEFTDGEDAQLFVPSGGQTG